MAKETNIGWCNHTINFWIGCTKVSAECRECYAETLAKFRGWAKWGDSAPRRPTVQSTKNQLKAWNRDALAANEQRRVFVNSLSDTFDALVPQTFRDEIFDYARATPFLSYLLLTKRAENLEQMLPPDLPANCWLGATVGVRSSLWRLERLREVAPGALKFLSIEPLLEDLGTIDLRGIDWVIVGGESGARARAMHPDWVRSILAQCRSANIPFFFKQWGEFMALPELDASQIAAPRASIF